MEYKCLVIIIQITVAETCQAEVIHIVLLTMRVMGLQSPEEHVVGVLVDEQASMNGKPRIFEVR